MCNRPEVLRRLRRLLCGSKSTASSWTCAAHANMGLVSMIQALGQLDGKWHHFECKSMYFSYFKSSIFLKMICVLGLRAGNIVLLQFLVGLKDSTKDELITELVVNTLKSSPDVLARYLKESVHSFIPRAKSAWQDNISLLKKVSLQRQISLKWVA